MIDALISLPILSFFALPMLSSYSTSLNLLFFYLTWSTLVLSHTPLNVEIFGTLFVRLLFFVLPSGLFLAFDLLLPSVSAGMKEHEDAALPKRYNRKRIARVIGVALFNILLSVGFAAGVELLLTEVLHWRSALRIQTSLPMPWHMGIDVVRAFAIRGALQYAIHRYLLHSPKKPILTRLHLNWAHSIKTPFPFVSAYDHPIPYLLHRFLPIYLPCVIFRYHILTYELVLALSSLEESFVYSGYSVLPSTIILSGMARRTEGHYHSGGKGNYGPTGILDWACGTGVQGIGKGENIKGDLEDEADKRDVKGRAGSLADSIGDYLDETGTNLRKKGKNKKRG